MSDDSVVITIYALTDPDTHKIRYIGQTVNLLHRYRSHVTDQATHPKSRWIKRLRSQGQRPGVVVIDRVVHQPLAWERWYITQYQQQGEHLLNSEYARLSRLQRRTLTWLWTEAQRTDGQTAGNHRALVQSLTRFGFDKSNISTSLKGLAAKGYVTITRTSGGKADAVALTARGCLYAGA